jgi:phosphate-selective porin OprO/OprP
VLLALGMLFGGVRLVAAAEAPELSFDVMYDSNAFEGDIFLPEFDHKTTETYLRRAKFSVEWDINKNLETKLSLDYDTDEKRFKVDDAVLTYEFSKSIELLIGRFKEPTGLENQQSLKTQYLLERSAPTNLFTFGRNTGVGLYYFGDQWLAQTAVMKLTGEESGVGDSLAYVGRLAVAPIDKKQRFLHLALGASTRKPTRLEYKIDTNLIAPTTGDQIKSADYGANNIAAANAEFAAKISPFLIQAEYFLQRLKTDNLGTIDLDGSYVSLLWTLAGKQRDYEDGEIKFKDADHTLELAYRYSYVNLTGGVRSDAASVYELAMNYYYRDWFKFVTQYERADRQDFDGDGFVEKAEGNSLNFRLQFMWN